MKIAQRRRLTDLYARGEFLELNDGDGPSVVLWIRKMTPVEAETAYVKASAKRATIIAGARSDPPSDIYLSLKTELDNFTKDDLIAWVVGSDLVRIRPVVEARLGDAEEWKKDRYLEGLKERLYEDDFVAKEPDDPEVVRVRAELQRFSDSVEEEIEKERSRLQRDYSIDSQAELQEKVLDDMLQGQGDVAWLNEFQRCQVWLCTFDGEARSEQYFHARAEVDAIQTEVYRQILAVIERINVGDSEGKDSQQTEVSSSPPASPEVREMVTTSSPLM